MIGAYPIGSQPIGASWEATGTPAPTPEEPSGPTVTISLVNESGAPLASLSSLKWAFFDEASPELLTAPVAKGSAETTDESGNLVIDVTGTSHTTGGIGWLVLSTSDGNPSGTYRQLCGPVTVA